MCDGIMMVSRVEAICLDLTGTLYVQNMPIPGAVEALSRLRATGVKIKFVTNDTTESMRILHKQLLDMGFDIKREEIYSALCASRDLVVDRKLRPFLMVNPTSLEEFEGIATDNPNVVLLGCAPCCFNYDQLNKAFRLLMSGALLIAMFRTRYFPTADGQINLGPGPFVAALEYATSTTAENVGKPQKTFFLGALESLGATPENTLMVGDDVRDDIEGALLAGMGGVLLRTGKYRDGDEEKICPPPNMVFQDFPSFVNHFLRIRQSTSR